MRSLYTKILLLSMFVAMFIFAPVDISVSRLDINFVDARCAPPGAALGGPTDCTFEELIGDNGWTSQDCINGKACDRQDRNIIEFFANGGCAKIKGGCSAEQLKQLANVGKNVQGAFGSTNCTLSWGNLAPLYSPTCWGRTISVLVGTALITATAWLLAAAGYLFNLLIDHTVIQFGSALLKTGVREAIDVGWTALRDIANIVIIAMFVFIAINIILGVKEFGEKRLVARVLIIAVLINFSLLFTKAIIDASNFTAYQFVKASGFVPDTADTQGAFEGEFVKKGIAGKFIKFMGLASLGETYRALSNAAFGNEKNQYATANGWFALLHGLVSATLLLFAAAALLYGCYLLITRAVLLIFLMMTSALAFASWLIPQQRIVKGFARWWEALLKAALFGPLLVIFLWASLNVAQAITTATQRKGTLGALLSNPEETLNLEALFSYVIVLGLLFASIYAANILSQGIAGFAAAGNLVKGATFAGPAIAWRFTGAPFLRQTAGRFAYGRQGALGDAAVEERRKSGQLRQEADQLRLYGNEAEAKAKEAEARKSDRKAARMAMASGRWSNLAKAGFNVGSAASFKTLGKMVGTPLLSSAERSREAAGGFADAVARKIKAGEERAQPLAVSGPEREKIHEAALKTKVAEHAEGRQALKQEEERHQRDRDDRATARDRAKQELSRLGAENIRIEDARRHSDANVLRFAEERDREQAGVVAAEAQLTAAKRALREFNEQTVKDARAAAEETVNAAERGAAEAARVVGKKMAGIETPAMRKHIGDKVRNKFRSDLATKSLRDALAMQLKDAETGKAAPSPSLSSRGSSSAGPSAEPSSST